MAELAETEDTIIGSMIVAVGSSTIAMFDMFTVEEATVLTIFVMSLVLLSHWWNKFLLEQMIEEKTEN